MSSGDKWSLKVPPVFWKRMGRRRGKAKGESREGRQAFITRPCFCFSFLFIWDSGTVWVTASSQWLGTFVVAVAILSSLSPLSTSPHLSILYLIFTSLASLPFPPHLTTVSHSYITFPSSSPHLIFLSFHITLPHPTSLSPHFTSQYPLFQSLTHFYLYPSHLTFPSSRPIPPVSVCCQPAVTTLHSCWPIIASTPPSRIPNYGLLAASPRWLGGQCDVTPGTDWQWKGSDAGCKFGCSPLTYYSVNPTFKLYVLGYWDWGWWFKYMEALFSDNFKQILLRISFVGTDGRRGITKIIIRDTTTTGNAIILRSHQPTFQYVSFDIIR